MYYKPYLLFCLFMIALSARAQQKHYEQIDLLVQNQETQAAIGELKAFVQKKGRSFPYLQLAKIYEQAAERVVYENPSLYQVLMDSAIQYYALSIKYLTKSDFKKFSGYFARELQIKQPSIEECKKYISVRQAEKQKEQSLQRELTNLSQQIKTIVGNQADIFNNLLKANTLLSDFLFSFEEPDRVVLEELIALGQELQTQIDKYHKAANSPYKQSFKLVGIDKPELIRGLEEQFAGKNVLLYDFGSWAKQIKRLLAKIPSWQRDLQTIIKRFDAITDSLEVGKVIQSTVEDDTFNGLCQDFLAIDIQAPLVSYLYYRRDKIELLAYHNDFYSLAIDPRTEESYRSRLMEILAFQSNLTLTRLDSLIQLRNRMVSYEPLLENIFGSLSRFYELLEGELILLQNRAARYYQVDKAQTFRGFYRNETFELNGVIHFATDTSLRKEGFYSATHAAKLNENRYIVGGYFLNPQTGTLDAFVCSVENSSDSTASSLAKVHWIRKFSMYLDKLPSDDKVTCLTVSQSGVIALSILARRSDEYESKLVVLDIEGQIVLSQEVINNGIIQDIRLMSHNELALLVGSKEATKSKELEKYRYLKINLKGEIIFQNVFSVKGNICGFFLHPNGAYIFANFLDYTDNKQSRVFPVKPFYRSLLLDLDYGGFIRRSHLLFEGKPSFVSEIKQSSPNQFTILVTHDVKDQEPQNNVGTKIKEELAF